MKKIALVLAMVLMGILIGIGVSNAAPFLVCDPQTGVTSYKLTGPVWVPTSTPAQADGSIKLDVASSTVGSNSLTVAACKTDPIWGELCSSTVPFVFTRPAAPTIPANTKLIP
jgi:LDH2 family malate/lactate/ureidoglycolate dehydrogenase